MAISRRKFIDKYLEEFLEHIQVIENSIIELKHDPSNEEALSNILRALHSIKGSSRMLKFSNIEKISHGLENVFKGIKDKRYVVNNAISELVLITVDYLRFGSGKINNSMEDQFNSLELLKIFDKVFAAEPFSLAEVLAEKASFNPAGAADPVNSEDGGAPDKHEISGTSLSEIKTIRINTEVVNGIVRDINDLILRQMQFKKDFIDFDAIIDELDILFRFLKKNIDGAAAFELNKFEKSLSQKLSRFKKNYMDSQKLVEDDSFKIQEEMLNLTMLPVNMIFGSLERMVEETADSLKKEIRLKTSGVDVYLDKNVLEKIQDPVIHIIRNSVDHGIELPDVREKNGKCRTGEIQLACRSERGKIVISIKDDGQGLDYAGIRKKALKLHPDMEEEINNMQDADLNTFLFSPGFSTKRAVSELSGRGVGLDIVKNNIEKIKGTIRIISKKNFGTEFIMTLPLSLATSNGYFIDCVGHKFFLPSEFVERIVTIEKSSIIQMANQAAFTYEGRMLPLYDLASLLHEEAVRHDVLNVVVIKSFDDTVGMIVDIIIERSLLIFKSLPPLISDLDAVQGVVFDEYFNMVCILHIPALISMFKSMKSIDRNITSSGRAINSGRVLVVDDSEYTREIERSILEKENFQVDTAFDGIDALEKIRTFNYHLIITDIEMPRMNGMILIENIRKNEHAAGAAETPVMVISTHKEHSVIEEINKLGISQYLSKSSFDRGDFISAVRRIIGIRE